MSEIKAEGRIRREEFARLFHSTPKADLLLGILDKEAKKCKMSRTQALQTQDINSICKEIFSHIKVLVNIYQRIPASSSEGEKLLLEKDKHSLRKRITELYSLKAFDCIDALAKKIALHPETACTKDKAVKKLIVKEYLFRSKNKVSAFSFPHESIIDHYVPLIQW